MEQWFLGAELRRNAFLKGRIDPFEMLPNQRYDRMFELMGLSR